MGDLKTVSISESLFDEAYKLLEQSFPKSEIRSYREMKKILSYSNYRMIGFLNHNQEICGLLGTWDLGLFMFVEHLAVDPNRRGNGIGSKIMRSFLECVDKPIILEVEDPVDEIKHRRVQFYERLGFTFNPLGYIQPMLQQSRVPVKLKLMSYPKRVGLAKFSILKEKIFKTVYMS